MTVQAKGWLAGLICLVALALACDPAAPKKVDQGVDKALDRNVGVDRAYCATGTGKVQSEEHCDGHDKEAWIYVGFTSESGGDYRVGQQLPQIQIDYTVNSTNRKERKSRHFPATGRFGTNGKRLGM